MKININGVNYYYEWFSSYQADRPTLVCLHGFTGTSQTFASVFQEDSEINILGIDLIGHGKTDYAVHPYRYQLDGLCQDIVLLTENLGLKQFYLLGYSMGARAALGISCLFPAKVQQLILESGSPGLSDVSERLVRQRSDERLAGYLLSHSIKAFVKKWESLPLFASQKKLPIQVQETIRQERLSQSRFGLACSLWYMGTGVQPSFWDKLTSIKIPVQLIVGELDFKFIQLAHEMKNRQPSFSVKTIVGAGHCVHLEKPEEFAKASMNFLKGGSRDDD